MYDIAVVYSIDMRCNVKSMDQRYNLEPDGMELNDYNIAYGFG